MLNDTNFGKIDPKRAIPRDEQERTSKIFVGGVSQEATEQDFKQFFMQFGRVVDATLMIDKDTGRPRGFGFVTFDSEAAVEATLSRPLEILGKPIEVKKAQPRGNMRDDDGGRGGMRRGMRDDRFRDDDRSGADGLQHQNTQGQANAAGGMTPQMMAQYWQRMQQYFSLMQQQMAVAAVQGQQMGPGVGAMNPAMMQQMQQMQQMKQAQDMNTMGGAQPQPGMSPQSPSPGPQGMQGMMSPAMMQQMPQNQGQAGAGYGGSGIGGQMGPGGANAEMGNTANDMGGAGNFTGPRGGPGYNAQEQLAFEQQKYEQQQVRRAMEGRNFSGYQQGGPTSWEGMYDDVPQPSIPTGPQGGMGRGGGGMGRGMSPSQSVSGPASKPSPQTKFTTPQPQSSPPANAPTGPRNAGKPGANYRGGGRGAHRGFHPYSRG